MQGSRTLVIQRKPKLVLDKRFGVFKDLNVGDEGQFVIEVEIVGEHMEFREDGVDLIVKELAVKNIEKIPDGNTRR